MEFEELEEKEEEMGATLPSDYGLMTNSLRPKMRHTTTAGEGGSTARKNRTPIRYRECLKNHAVSIGGHAVDGCGEFMASGEEGTLDALKCSACNCHRNFHRKETDGGDGCPLIYHQQHPHHQQFPPYCRAPPPPAGYLHLTPPRPITLPLSSGGGGGYSRENEDVSNPSSSGGGCGGMKKKFRTKFTPEQKEKMLGFSERLGWRIQQYDEAAVEQFCAKTGVKRQALKVWMHNNKHTLGKKP